MRKPLLALSVLLISAASLAMQGGSQTIPGDARAVQDLVGRMTFDEKIGQMTQPDQMFLKDISDIDTLFPGSLLNGGDSDPKTKSFAGALRAKAENTALREARGVNTSESRE